MDDFEEKSNPFSDNGSDIYIDAIIYYVDTVNNVFDAISKDQLRQDRKSTRLNSSHRV